MTANGQEFADLESRVGLKIRTNLLDFGCSAPAVRRQTMTQPLPPLAPLCSICHKPVDLKTSKTDSKGQAVHEWCYSAQLAQGKSSSDRA